MWENQDALADMQNYRSTSWVYWEMVGLYKELFVTFLLDSSRDIIYQVDAAGEGYYLKKGKPEWKPFEGNISKKAIQIPRKQAERLEENWNEPFWEKLEDDLKEGGYKLFSSPSRVLWIGIADRKLTLLRRDFSEECNGMILDGEYEFFYTLDEKDTYTLLKKLRLKHGLRKKLNTVLCAEFGVEDGYVKLKELCDSLEIVPGFFSC